MTKRIIDEFIEKVKKQGYTVRIDSDGKTDRTIISEDNFYHVAIDTRIIFEAPFDYIMKHVEMEIKQLKERGGKHHDQYSRGKEKANRTNS